MKRVQTRSGLRRSAHLSIMLANWKRGSINYPGSRPIFMTLSSNSGGKGPKRPQRASKGLKIFFIVNLFWLKPERLWNVFCRIRHDRIVVLLWSLSGFIVNHIFGEVKTVSGQVWDLLQPGSRKRPHLAIFSHIFSFFYVALLGFYRLSLLFNPLWSIQFLRCRWCS